jgi:hypothetical protein
MLDLVSKLPTSLFKKQEAPVPHLFNFVKDRVEMLKTILACMETGKLIGIYSRALGDGMFLTGVDNVESDTRGKVIVFETYDFSGQILTKTRVYLDEIKMVCPFEVEYIHPLTHKGTR